MKKRKSIIKFILPVFILILSPIILNANLANCCTWSANGCDNAVIINGDDSVLITDCGGGPVAVGTGSYGGCPGEVGTCGNY